jgi:CDP-paratose 2-epimerase
LPGSQKVYISDIRKAKEKLGWEPKISWREGIMRLYNWVFDNRQLFMGGLRMLECIKKIIFQI